MAEIKYHFTDADKKQILADRRAGVLFRVIAEPYGCDPTTISKLVQSLGGDPKPGPRRTRRDPLPGSSEEWSRRPVRVVKVPPDCIYNVGAGFNRLEFQESVEGECWQPGMVFEIRKYGKATPGRRVVIAPCLRAVDVLTWQVLGKDNKGKNFRWGKISKRKNGCSIDARCGMVYDCVIREK